MPHRHSFLVEKMLTVRIIAVGKMKEQFYKDAFAEYAKRLGGYCRFECIEVAESTLDKEAENVIKYIDKGSFVIAMCVEGKKLSSEALAEKMASLMVGGCSELVFLIGGSVGLASSLKDRADFRLSMSDMTFPHHLARVMIAEQIYRCFKILEGSIYHK